MNRKHQQSIYHVNVNVNLMEENEIQIRNEIMKNVGASVKALCMSKTSCYM